MRPIAQRSGLTLIALICLLAVPRPAAAADGGGDWWLSLTPYAWLPTLDGDLTIGDQEGSSDEDTGDSLNIFDTSVNWGAALHMEAGTGKFGFMADAMYVSLESERTASEGGRSLETEGFIGELGMFYTLIGEPVRPRAKRGLRVDALGGVRFTSLRLRIESDGVLDEASERANRYDPFVGARAELGLFDWLSLKGRADVGGFGISEDVTSELTWSVGGFLSFHFGDNVDFDLGYRYLYYDFDDDDVSLDASLAGPFLGLTFWL